MSETEAAPREPITRKRREWSILRPADAGMFAGTPIGPPFVTTEDEVAARMAAERTFTADVLAECPLAYADVTETEFVVVGLAPEMAARRRGEGASS